MTNEARGKVIENLQILLAIETLEYLRVNHLGGSPGSRSIDKQHYIITCIELLRDPESQAP